MGFHGHNNNNNNKTIIISNLLSDFPDCRVLIFNSRIYFKRPMLFSAFPLFLFPISVNAKNPKSQIPLVSSSIFAQIQSLAMFTIHAKPSPPLTNSTKQIT